MVMEIIHAADLPGALLTGGNDVTRQVANDVEFFADQVMAAILHARKPENENDQVSCRFLPAVW